MFPFSLDFYTSQEQEIIYKTIFIYNNNLNNSL